MSRIICLFTSISLLLQSFWLPLAWAQSNESLSLKREDAKTGSIYYSSSKKNELVSRTNIWGAVQYPGVHYIPVGTRFLEAISIAGGPLDQADIGHVTLATVDEQKKEPEIHTISLQEALAVSSQNPILRPDDVIIIKQDHARENTQLWLGIGTFVLSAVALGYLISDQNKH